jgi:hypothetical protein
LVRITAVERQYHTLFDWDDKKINKFLSFFGADFKAKCATEIAANTELTDSARAFMQLGTLRNVIVHQNYLTVRIDKTASEILDDYHKATLIISFLSERLLKVGRTSAVRLCVTEGASIPCVTGQTFLSNDIGPASESRWSFHLRATLRQIRLTLFFPICAVAI